MFTTPEVAAVYKALSALDGRERKALFQALTSEAKAGIWKMHLEVFLVEHDDLTADQRALVSQMAGLVRPSLYDAPGAAGIFAVNSVTSTDEIDPLIARASMIFSPGTVDSLLYRLGPPADGRTRATRRWRIQTNSMCDCSTVYPECDCDGGGCIKWKGCGPMQLDGCNGLCQ
ncbi:MAG TPA: bacteriocin fulvocin C-related protein [Thermoanaerobaculia bacterium]|nr:bacteriocin fulvocin C-related protein [Thermoanaerobaculia bacterium]